ncbi:MAG: hypothetical protein HFE66_06440 [Clostridiales bacterium]|jgi:hypothetical protein|nr:hypothetical protein [Clostridiales bacterium]
MKQYFKCITSIFLAAVLAIGCSGCADNDDVKEESSAVTTEEVEQTEPTNVEPADTSADTTPAAPVLSELKESEDAGEAYQNKIIFVGDSTTHHLRNREVLPGGKNTTQVWTPTCGTLTLAYVLTAKILYPETNTEMTIMEAAGIKKPEIMVIALGMNGISFMEETNFKTVYASLIQGILEQSPNTEIILQSIYPRAQSVHENYASITQDMIDTGNVWIQELAQECGVYYLDTQTILKDENGYLRAEYGVEDGIHISRDGYLAILQFIRTHPIPPKLA